MIEEDVIDMDIKELYLIQKGYEVKMEDAEAIVFSKKVRVIPWPITLILALVFLPLILLLWWKKEDIKVVTK